MQRISSMGGSEQGSSMMMSKDPRIRSDVEEAKPIDPVKPTKAKVLSSRGFALLVLLAFFNTSKNIVGRAVMKDQPKFLYSVAVLGSEFIKLCLSLCYIIFVDKRPFQSVVQYLRDDMKNTLLLIVPASAYGLNASLVFVALSNLDAALFSIAVQSKLLFTAGFAFVFLKKHLKYIQIISLVLLMSGVILCNIDAQRQKEQNKGGDAEGGNIATGLIAVVVIALSSGLASVFTEKVIKSQRRSVDHGEYGLAYTQVQLALMGFSTMGTYALWMDFGKILEGGLFQNFTPGAFLNVLLSAVGGLIVASVLKYADAILKNYATAMTVVMTGMLSMFLFGTQLGWDYLFGMVNVLAAVFLYGNQHLHEYVCKGGSVNK